MKLYAVSDGPPSLAVRMTLKALDIQYQLINVDFCAMEHRSEEYSKVCAYGVMNLIFKSLKIQIIADESAKGDTRAGRRRFLSIGEHCHYAIPLRQVRAGFNAISAGRQCESSNQSAAML